MSDDRSARLEQVLADYLQSVESGRPLDQAELLRAHADLADDLRSFFTNQAAVAAWAKPLQHLSPADMATLTGEAAWEAESRVRRIRYLGDYELLDEVARGGMGIVYKARQASLNRVVAVKMVLSGQLASETEVHRFRREAEAAAGLDHAAIVPIYEVGTHEGQHYFSMKLIEGGSLRDALTKDGGRLDPRRGVELTTAVARGLQHAHERGVLHRDLKPGNILLDTDGAPLITDFGLAKRVSGTGASDLTSSGAILGTPSYMAPEQAAGRGPVTTAADVYSVGAVLYELLTGRPPFHEATPVQTLVAVIEREPTAPSRFVPKLDRDLETITLKCLEKDPARRYKSAADLADDLERWQRGEPIRARPVGTWESLRRWCGRHRAVTAAIALGGVALLASIALTVGSVFTWRLREEQARTQAALRDVQAERSRAERIEVDAAMERGQLLCEQGEIAAGTLSMARALELAPADDAELQLQIRERLGAWTPALHRLTWRERHPTGVWFLDVSGDGARLLVLGGDSAQLREAATGRPVGPVWKEGGDIRAYQILDEERQAATLALDGTVRFVSLETGLTLRRVSLPGGPYTAVALSRDGRLAAATRFSGQVAVWNAQTGALAFEAPFPGWSESVAFSPSGKVLVVAGVEGAIFRWDVATGAARGEPWSAAHKRILFGPQEDLLATFSGRPSVRLWTLDAATEIEPPLLHRDQVYRAAFNARGDMLATASIDQTAQVWKLNPTQQHRVPLRHARDVRACAFSPDSELLATGAADRTARVWETFPSVPLGGPPRGAPLLHEALVHAVVFSPDNRYLYTSALDGAVNRWEVTAGRLPSRLFSLIGLMTSLAVSPDGRRAAAGTREGGLRIYPLENSKEPGLDTRLPGQVHDVVFTPDGGRLVTGDAAGGVQVWNAETGVEVWPRWDLKAGLPDSPDQVIDVDVRRDGTQAMATFGRRVHRWNLTTGKRIEPSLEHPEAVTLAQFSPDGTQILTVSDSLGGQLWDAGTGLPIGSPLSTDHVRNAVFSPNGREVLLGTHQRRGWLVDVATRRTLSGGLLHENILGPLAISADGQRLFTASDDTTVRIWSRDGARQHPPLAHHGIVGAIGLSPDGRHLITLTDAEAQLWDVASGRRLGLPFPARRGEWWHGVAWLPDSRGFLTAWPDEGVRLWQIPAAVPGTPNAIRRDLESRTGAGVDDNGRLRSQDPAPSAAE